MLETRNPLESSTPLSIGFEATTYCGRDGAERIAINEERIREGLLMTMMTFRVFNNRGTVLCCHLLETRNPLESSTSLSIGFEATTYCGRDGAERIAINEERIREGLLMTMMTVRVFKGFVITGAEMFL